MVLNFRPINGMDQVDVSNKRVLVRVDHNVPCSSQSEIRDDERIVRSIETLRELASHGARVILLSHFGYPMGRRVPSLSTRILATRLGMLMGKQVQHCGEMSLARAKELADQVEPGEFLYLENSRFWEGEQSDSSSLATDWAKCGDIYVNEAFSASHRRHASMHSLSNLLPAFAGRQLERERRELLSQRDASVEHGLLLGGSKLDQKLKAISRLEGELSVLCIGGMTSVAVMKSVGQPTGGTELSPSRMDTVAGAWKAMLARGLRPLLPVDWAVRAENGEHRVVTCESVSPSDTIIDIGPETVQGFLEALSTVPSVFWNGPLGVYEEPSGAHGSAAVARGLARRVREGAQVVLGGGDTLAFIAAIGMSDAFTFCSSGGGAALEFIGRGDELPGLVNLFGTN